MTSIESHTDRLIELGMLNLEDLETNLSGHLSDRQKRALYVPVVLWLALAVFEISLMRMFVYMQIVLQRNIVAGLAIIGIFLFMIPACITNARPYWQDIQDDGPKAVSGQIFKRFTTTSAGPAEEGCQLDIAVFG